MPKHKYKDNPSKPKRKNTALKIALSAVILAEAVLLEEIVFGKIQDFIFPPRQNEITLVEERHAEEAHDPSKLIKNLFSVPYSEEASFEGTYMQIREMYPELPYSL